VSKRATGVALISVLLIVAILMAVISRLMSSHNLVINQHQNTFEQNQALQYALGAEALARQALYEDFTNSGKDVDHYNELWAQPTMPFELDEGGFLEAQLTDLQGCFNLNSLAEESGIQLERFKRLLNNLSVQPQLADAWKDWIDADEKLTGFGAEDSEYLIAMPPHRTPNNPVYHVSELLLVQNMEREQYLAIAPHVCTLPPEVSSININTANAQTLAALDGAIDPAMAEQLVASERAYMSAEDFIADYSDFAPLAGELSVTSEYFQLHAQAQLGSSSVTLLSLMYRDPSTGIVSVLQRDFGRLFRSNLTIDTEEI